MWKLIVVLILVAGVAYGMYWWQERRWKQRFLGKAGHGGGPDISPTRPGDRPGESPR